MGNKGSRQKRTKNGSEKFSEKSRNHVDSIGVAGVRRNHILETIVGKLEQIPTITVRKQVSELDKFFVSLFVDAADQMPPESFCRFVASYGLSPSSDGIRSSGFDKDLAIIDFKKWLEIYTGIKKTSLVRIQKQFAGVGVARIAAESPIAAKIFSCLDNFEAFISDIFLTSTRVHAERAIMVREQDAQFAGGDIRDIAWQIRSNSENEFKVRLYDLFENNRLKEVDLVLAQAIAITANQVDDETLIKFAERYGLGGLMLNSLIIKRDAGVIKNSTNSTANTYIEHLRSVIGNEHFGSIVDCLNHIQYNQTQDSFPLTISLIGTVRKFVDFIKKACCVSLDGHDCGQGAFALSRQDMLRRVEVINHCRKFKEELDAPLWIEIVKNATIQDRIDNNLAISIYETAKSLKEDALMSFSSRFGLCAPAIPREELQEICNISRNTAASGTSLAKKVLRANVGYENSQILTGSLLYLSLREVAMLLPATKSLFHTLSDFGMFIRGHFARGLHVPVLRPNMKRKEVYEYARENSTPADDARRRKLVSVSDVDLMVADETLLYITKLSGATFDIFCSRYGIMRKREKLIDIAERLGLTSERCRQIEAQVAINLYMEVFFDPESINKVVSKVKNLSVSDDMPECMKLFADGDSLIRYLKNVFFCDIEFTMRRRSSRLNCCTDGLDGKRGAKNSVEISDTGLLTAKKNRSFHVRVNGREYPNLVVASEDLDIPIHRLKRRRKKAQDRGLNPDEVHLELEAKTSGAIAIEIDGVRFPSIAAAAREYNVPANLAQLRRSLGKKGRKVVVGVRSSEDRCSMKGATLIDDMKFRSFLAVAEYYGVSQSIIYKRYEEGLRGEDLIRDVKG